MKNIVMQHPERVMPAVVRNFCVLGPEQEVLAVVRDNHSAVVVSHFDSIDHCAANEPPPEPFLAVYQAGWRWPGFIISAAVNKITTDRLIIELEHPSDQVPASLFEVRCYARHECS